MEKKELKHGSLSKEEVKEYDLIHHGKKMHEKHIMYSEQHDSVHIPKKKLFKGLKE